MKFCKKYGCDNVLKGIVRGDSLIYQCSMCFEEYNSGPSDTLMIDEYLQESDTTYKHRNYLRNAHSDTISELCYKNCNNEKCDETIMRVIKISEHGTAIYVCPKCKSQFA